VRGSQRRGGPVRAAQQRGRLRARRSRAGSACAARLVQHDAAARDQEARGGRHVHPRRRRRRAAGGARGRGRRDRCRVGRVLLIPIFFFLFALVRRALAPLPRAARRLLAAAAVVARAGVPSAARIVCVGRRSGWHAVPRGRPERRGGVRGLRGQDGVQHAVPRVHYHQAALVAATLRSAGRVPGSAGLGRARRPADLAYPGRPTTLLTLLWRAEKHLAPRHEVLCLPGKAEVHFFQSMRGSSITGVRGARERQRAGCRGAPAPPPYPILSPMACLLHLCTLS